MLKVVFHSVIGVFQVVDRVLKYTVLLNILFIYYTYGRFLERQLNLQLANRLLTLTGG